MDLARASRIAEWALVVGVGLLHVIIFCWAERADQPNFLVSAAHDAQLLSAIVLILAWTVLGPGWVWVRGAALPILIAAWFLPWNTRMFPRETAALFPLWVAASAALIVLVVRICRLRVVPMTSGGRPERGAQFSILAMLIATTLIAAGVGLLEGLRPILAGDIDQLSSHWRYVLDTVEDVLRPSTVRSLVAAGAVACAAVAGIWVVLRPGAIWVRLAALVVGLGVLGVYLPHLSGVAADSFRPTAINLSVSLAAIAGLAGLTVLPLRLLDFRLQRVRGGSLREPGREAASAPADGAASKPTERRRLAGRAAALLGLVMLLGGIPFFNRLTEQNDELQAPSTAFAEWSDARRSRILFLLNQIEIEWVETTYVQNLRSIDAERLETPILVEVSPPDESAKSPPDETK